MADLASFLTTLRQSGLLDDRQVGELESSVTSATPRTLADELVRRAWLTEFQADQLAAGQGDGLVLGQYVLLDRIGEGGMGQVFKARHRLMQRIVALKVIKKDQLDSPQAIQRFHREIRAVAQLAHPNVVLAHDADQVGDTHFFVMEYVEGIDLGKRVKREGPVPFGLACEYIRQAALGLQHAHERGLVHRDIKPSNLLLASPGREPREAICVKVLDLGLARLRQAEGDQHTLTEDGAVMGTPDFMAPEQAQDSRQVDIRADLYALGCTLFYLIAGRVVFPADSYTSKLFKHWSEEPEPIESLRPEVPAEVSAIIRKLLAKKPADRYQTPAALAAALTPFCTQRKAPDSKMAELSAPAGQFDTVAPAPGPSGTAPEKKSSSWKPDGDSKTVPAEASRRKPLLAVMAVALAVALGVGGWLASSSRQEPDDGPAKAAEPERSPTAQVKKAEEPGQQQAPALVQSACPPAEERPAAAAPVESEEKPAAIPAAPAPPAQPVLVPGRHALLIGINRYETGDLPGLPYADADLEQVRLALVDMGYRAENIQSLTTTATPPRALEIRRELHRLRQRQAGDSVLIAVAGQVVQFSGNEECYLCPADARLDDPQSLIAFTEIYAALQACPAGFKLLVVDGQRPGVDQPGLTLPRPQNLPPPDGVAVWFSHSIGQRGHDYPERKQGLFFYWLAEALRSNAAHIEAHVGRRVFATAFQQRKQGQTPERLGSTNGPAPVPGLDAFTAPEPTGELATLHGHAEGITAVAFGPDGLSALSASTDSSVRLWDLEARREKRALDPDVVSVPWSAAFARDGKLAVIGTGGVKEAGRLKPGSPFHNTVRIWDAAAGREMKQLQGHGDYVTAVAFAPDGKLAASGSVDRTIRLWSVASGKETAIGKGHAGRVRAVAFTPDGQHLASVSDDQTVRLWSLTGKEIWRQEFGAAVLALAIAADGQRIAAACGDGQVRLLDRASGKEVASFPGHEGGTTGVAFSPSGRRILTCGGDRALRLWDASTGKQIACLKGHTEGVAGVAYGPTGRQALSGGSDRTVRLWALPRE